MMQITARAGRVSGWDANLENIVTCGAKSLARICPCSVWQSYQTGTEELSEHPGAKGNRVIKSSLLVLLPLSQGRLNTLKV